MCPTSRTAAQLSPPSQAGIATRIEINQKTTIQVCLGLASNVARSARLRSSEGASRTAESNAGPESVRITSWLRRAPVMQNQNEGSAVKDKLNRLMETVFV